MGEGQRNVEIKILLAWQFREIQNFFGKIAEPDFKNSRRGRGYIAGSFLAKKFGDIGTFGDIGHFRRYGNKNKFFRSKNKNA